MKTNLELEPIKDKMIMVRLDPRVYKEVSEIAKVNKTSRGKIIRALIDKSLTLSRM
jgi:ribbon-helix-helix CopG family protein